MLTEFTTYGLILLGCSTTLFITGCYLTYHEIRKYKKRMKVWEKYIASAKEDAESKMSNHHVLINKKMPQKKLSSIIVEKNETKKFKSANILSLKFTSPKSQLLYNQESKEFVCQEKLSLEL